MYHKKQLETSGYYVLNKMLCVVRENYDILTMFSNQTLIGTFRLLGRRSTYIDIIVPLLSPNGRDCITKLCETKTDVSHPASHSIFAKTYKTLTT